MKPSRPPLLRGLTGQLLSITVLPLTVLLLFIAFGSVSLHQQDMRALVGERDERAVQSTSAALTSELHHRLASITSLGVFAGPSDLPSLDAALEELAVDFDGGLAFLDPGGRVLAAMASSEGFWAQAVEKSRILAKPGEAEPRFSPAFRDPASGRFLVIVSWYSESQARIAAGAFSPGTLAREILLASYPSGGHVNILLMDPDRQVLFSSGSHAGWAVPGEVPGLAEALHGESGTIYIKTDGIERVVAYSPVEPVGWALITEEEWEMVSSPSLRLTQMAPLVLVPAFVLALIALWFVARQIVRPLQRLEEQAAALAWGDFEAIKQPVGGIAEVRHLQMELAGMSRKVQMAQEGLHDYIGAITSAQEEERLRLARELHDDTIQSVIALKQRVQLAQRSVKDQASRGTLQELEKLAEGTIEDLRRMTRALRPIYLEDLGLATALEMLAGETGQNSALQVAFSKTGEEQRLSHEAELALYRIAQEALNNAVRHSEARMAEVLIDFGGEETVLEVSDDGTGFEMPKSPTDFAPAGHFGLLGIHERAELIGARLEVDSAPGRGTRIRVVLRSLPS